MESKPGRYGIESSLSFGWLHPAYWKTLAGLRKNVCNVAVESNGATLRFTDYPFQPASVYPNGVVELHQVAEVELLYPPQLRLTSGEILFVMHPYKDALLAFVNRNDIVVKQRSSVWSALLDPFVDTWEDQPTIDRQFAWLADLGLDREAVDNWRREVAPAMVAYNFGTGLWEWTSLNLYDVLTAQQARLSRAAFADFYSRAMRLAALDQERAEWEQSSKNWPDSALIAVLIDWYPREKTRGTEDFSRQWDVRNQHIERKRQALLAELSAAYSEPHRRYHTLPHIAHCLAELAKAWQYAVNLNEVRWALLFHDAIYDPRREDNESRSADWACRVLDELQRPEDEKARIRGMILATAHANEPRTADEALVLDVDLSILGADAAKFDDYDRAIRVEYEWVPEADYRKGRAGILRSFLERERIYHTAFFRRRYEKAARANLQRALDRLHAMK